MIIVVEAKKKMNESVVIWYWRPILINNVLYAERVAFKELDNRTDAGSYCHTISSVCQCGWDYKEDFKRKKDQLIILH